MDDPAKPEAQEGIPCDGWWQQQHYGRQPMENLRLRFECSKIAGSGIDIIGPFTLIGTISESGQVAMVKRYVGMHAVDYIGAYDGEGVMWGEWRIGSLHDRWLIKVQRSRTPRANGDDAEEIL